MSHSKERTEKICLNCGADLHGLYCHVCGQENIEPKETLWGLIAHFFNDITHFDGKFFSTARYLLTRPGFLPAEYIRGRRAAYLHPVRMYIFISAFFFIGFFWMINLQTALQKKDERSQLRQLTEANKALQEKLGVEKDSVTRAAMVRAASHINQHAVSLRAKLARQKAVDSSASADSAKGGRVKLVASGLTIDGEKDPGNIDFDDIETGYRSQIAYDSVQKELPENKRDGWVQKTLQKKLVILNKRWGNDKSEGLAFFSEQMLHSLPPAVFISLPLFALLLRMLYSSRRFYYVDHGIFAIHLYCAAFVIMLFIFAFRQMAVLGGHAWLRLPEALLILGLFFYLYKALRRFYGETRRKTILKFVILNFLALIIVALLMVFVFALSVIKFS